MKYYIITSEQARKYGLTDIRIGGSDGYLVSTGDISVFGIDSVLAEGAVEVTVAEAKKFVNKHNI